MADAVRSKVVPYIVAVFQSAMIAQNECPFNCCEPGARRRRDRKWKRRESATEKTCSERQAKFLYHPRTQLQLGVLTDIRKNIALLLFLVAPLVVTC
jgi:hypothetical protein